MTKVTDKTKAKLKRLMNQRAKINGGNLATSSAPRLVTFCLVTGAAVDGYYPCTVQSWNETEEEWTEYSDEAFLFDANGSVLKQDRRYFSQRSGDDIDGKPVFVTSLGKGTGEGDDGEGDCDGCSWLIDLPHEKALKLTIKDAYGRCECIDLSQGNVDGEEFDLVYDPTPGIEKWVGDRTFATCCGCGRFTFNVDSSGNPTVQIEINQACDETEDPADFTYASPYTYDLKLECCKLGSFDPDGNQITGPTAHFAGAGPKNCDGEPECQNMFRVKLECIPCDPLYIICPACQFTLAPRSFFLNNGTSFSGDYKELNGKWTLKHDEDDADCTWQTECNGVEMVLTLASDLGGAGREDDVYTATLTMGGLTYEGTSNEIEFTCLSGFTLNYSDPEELGLPEGAVSSVTLGIVNCDTDSCPCDPVLPDTLYLDLDIAAFGGVIPTVTLTKVEDVTPLRWQGEFEADYEDAHFTITATFSCNPNPDALIFDTDLGEYGPFIGYILGLCVNGNLFDYFPDCSCCDAGGGCTPTAAMKGSFETCCDFSGVIGFDICPVAGGSASVSCTAPLGLLATSPSPELASLEVKPVAEAKAARKAQKKKGCGCGKKVRRKSS